MTACPDPEELARYSDGQVTGELSEKIAAHVDGCASCREVLVTMVRTSTGGASPPPPSVDDPKRGDVIGRYVVLDARGAGGMGLVYSAHDSQLDRKVALKVVRPDVEEQGGAEKTKARLLREAQLMARVRHPSVVTVYDVGTLGERIFIAMELVDGVTLREWLRVTPRTRDDVLRVFIQAGRGLAAAHSAGVVHRDFKPDNVLIDATGDAHVTDFGIAWSNVTPNLEEAPGLMGTPAYMAPEQLAKKGIDARADQFAFCVALYEGLTGARPFAGLDRMALAPIPKEVGGRLTAALERGLSIEPERRFPDMDAVLKAIAPRSRVPALLGAAALVLVAAAAGVTFALTKGGSDCGSGPARLKGVWDAPRRAEIQSAFLATQASFAKTAFDSAAAALDRRTAEWVTAFETSCKQARDDEVRARQRVCLDARLGELRALADLFARADASVVERATLAADKLKGPQACLTSREALATLPLPDDAARRAAIASVRLKIAECEAQHVAGHLPQALALAREAIELARVAKYPPVLAEAWLALVEPLRDQGGYVEARKALDEAAIAAEAGRHFEAQTRIAVKRVRVIHSGHTEEADLWIKRAEAALAETPRPELQAELDSVVGNLRLAQRRPAEALAREAAARKFYEAEGRTAEALGARHVMALAKRAQGDAAGALDELMQATSEYAKALGPTHPLTLHVVIHVTEAMVDLGRAAVALKLLEREDLDGRLTPSWEAMRQTLRGDALRMLGRWDEALDAHRRAVEAASKGLGGDGASGGPRLRMAATLREMERFDEAEAELVAATAELREGGPLWPQLARLEVAELRFAQGRDAEAKELAMPALEKVRELVANEGAPERVAALLTASRAAKDPELAKPLWSIAPSGSVLWGRAHVRAGSYEVGFPVLREAEVFPLEQLEAAAAATCEQLAPLKALKLPPGAAKVLTRRCPK